MVGSEANRTSNLYFEASKSIASKYPTVTPATTGYYLEGRRNVESYTRSLVDIRESAYGTGLTLRNARMTDEQIENLINQMNLTPRQ